MPLSHLLLTLLAVLVWGFNFLFVALGLEEMPPLLLCALRFLVSSAPFIFFIKMPAGSFKAIALYGFVMFALQFGLLFTGMNHGMPAGMAALLLQTQVFFNMFFAGFFLGEKPNWSQIIGTLVSFSGVGIVAMHFDGDVSLSGFVLILLAAATWGLGNLITKKMKGSTDNVPAIITWGSFIACFPMFVFSFFVEGADGYIAAYQQISWRGIGAILYISFASTWMGYGIWNWLITRHPMGLVAPFTLLVPIVAMLSSAFILNEPFQHWKLAAGLLVILGLCINVFGTRLSTIRMRSSSQWNQEA